MLCGSLAARELTLTSLMYPYHVRESIQLSNIDSVGDLSLRNIWQHEKADETLTISNPKLTALSIRNLYQFWVQYQEKLHIKKPKLLRLALKNILNRYSSEKELFYIHHPKLAAISLRNFLQKLFTHPRDEVFEVHNPEILHLHHKNIVSKYNEIDFGKLYVDNIIFERVSLRNVLQAHEQHEALYITLPDDISFSGSVKPHIFPPVLQGEVDLGTVFSIPLEWEDESITHTGYKLYRDTQPIPSNTELEPFKEFSRIEDEYIDWDIEEDTTYYYRITPKTYLGRLFSNLLEVYVPLYLRAPHSFITGFASRTEPVNIKQRVLTISKSLKITKGFISLTEFQRVSGSFMNAIFQSLPRYSWNPLNKFREVSGTSKIDYVLGKEASLYSSLTKQGISFIEYTPEFGTWNEGYGVSLVREPVETNTSFLGVTKSFVRDSFVILGSLIEGHSINYSSQHRAMRLVGAGSREMMLRRPSAMILNEGRIQAFVGVYDDVLSLSYPVVHYLDIPSTGHTGGIYEPSFGTRGYKYKSVLISSTSGVAEYKPDFLASFKGYGFNNYTLGNEEASFEGTTSSMVRGYYCILGSNTENVYCSIHGALGIESVSYSSYSLNQIRKARAFLTEDQKTVIFSGFMPPAGMPMGYDTYQLGEYIIPIFKREYIIPNDDVRFTLYEKVYKSMEVTSGYEPPEGTKIDFSLFVDKK